MLSELVNDTDNFCSRHAFGDVRHPLLESAEIVEDIVKNQIQHLVVQAADTTNLRGGRLMNVDDVVFLLRHNKDKLKRIVRHLTYREIRQKAQKQMGVEEDDSTEIGYEWGINLTAI
jgi:transcription initiation protein SPT3